MNRRLSGIVRHWLRERRRDLLAEETRQSQVDFQAGRCPPKTPEEIVHEILRDTEAPTVHGG